MTTNSINSSYTINSTAPVLQKIHADKISNRLNAQYYNLPFFKKPFTKDSKIIEEINSYVKEKFKKKLMNNFLEGENLKFFIKIFSIVAGTDLVDDLWKQILDRHIKISDFLNFKVYCLPYFTSADEMYTDLKDKFRRIVFSNMSRYYRVFHNNYLPIINENDSEITFSSDSESLREQPENESAVNNIVTNNNVVNETNNQENLLKNINTKKICQGILVFSIVLVSIKIGMPYISAPINSLILNENNSTINSTANILNVTENNSTNFFVNLWKNIGKELKNI